jgi:hypothetical protein
MSDRGVMYAVWGDKVLPYLQRSIDSVNKLHPELPIHVEYLPNSSTLLDLVGIQQWSPFEETLFLGADQVVLGNLNYGFEQARKFGLALCINECPWARRYGGLDGDLLEYNSGSMFFTKEAKVVFDAWESCARTIDSSILFYGPDSNLLRMPYNDQAGLAKAMHDINFNPFILPFNWNFRPMWYKSFWGPIKIWHDYSDPPPAIIEVSENQERLGSIIQYFDLSGWRPETHM